MVTLLVSRVARRCQSATHWMGTHGTRPFISANNLGQIITQSPLTWDRGNREETMATAKELHIWANTVKQWIAKIDNARMVEHLTQVAAEMERLADNKDVTERQLV